MKKLFYLILSITLLTTACKPDRLCCVLPSNGTAITAQRNGVLWNPQYFTGVRSNINLITFAAASLTGNTTSSNKTDSLNIQIADVDGKNIYKLKSSQVFYATYDPSGAATIFKLDTTYNNVLNVTGYDVLVNNATLNPNEINIKATFDLKFIDPNNAAGISFTNGSFSALMSQ